MKCACGFENDAAAPACNLCGAVLKREGSASATSTPPPAVRAETAPTGWKGVLGRRAVAFGIGVAFFPVAKVLLIPNIAFNFLTTLVHECGHAACALLVGRPSIPTVSLGGGGVTVWGDQVPGLAFLAWAGIGSLIGFLRNRRGAMIAAIAATTVYPLLAFTGMKNVLPIAGGVLVEIVGAAACFYVALGWNLRRPFERPLYALWGMWMLLNRAGETLLMIRDPKYWNDTEVYESGLAAGLADDLHLVQEQLHVQPPTLLWGVMTLCVLALPVAALLAWLCPGGHGPVAEE